MLTGKLVSIYATAPIAKCTCNHSWTFPLPHNCGKFQDGTNASMFSAIMLQNNNISVKQTKYV